MDLSDVEIFGVTQIPDEDSGSSYEAPSESGQSESHSEDDVVAPARPVKAGPEKRRDGSSSGNNRPKAIRDGLAGSRSKWVDSDRERGRSSKAGPTMSPANGSGNEVFEDVMEWASKFQPAQSAGDVHSPSRKPAGSRSKRKAKKQASHSRAKRVKGCYNREYLNLLNIDINDAARRKIHVDHFPLPSSQIGSSMWAVDEKRTFFSALDRLGRDDVRGIAARIESKSELQVQEYLLLLHHATMEKKARERPLLAVTDLPAALEISEVCEHILERAADALASRQEISEEKTEQEKWGGIWLLTEDVCRQLEERRKEDEAEIEEVIPAINLLNLKTWLELSSRVFMNPSAPLEQNNWENLAEAGEYPAIRTTAFEDFHSLAVSITKRLISTTLFCTMSRIRAKHAQKIKHSEVNVDDVQAAVNILRLTPNSDQFWVKAARRCNLQILNDKSSLLEERESPMTYDEVEAALRSAIPARSQSAGRGTPSRAYIQTTIGTDDPATQSESGVDSLESETDGVSESVDGTDNSKNISFSDSDVHSPGYQGSGRPHTAKALKAAERAQDSYTEALDKQVSQMEEARLWAMLKQTPPFKIEVEPFEIERPKLVRGDVDLTENWRDFLDFRNHWEILETPVPDEAFEKNRKRKSRRARNKEYSARAGAVMELAENEESNYSDEIGDSENRSSSSFVEDPVDVENEGQLRRKNQQNKADETELDSIDQDRSDQARQKDFWHLAKDFAYSDGDISINEQ